jgi:hypothetical protein
MVGDLELHAYFISIPCMVVGMHASHDLAEKVSESLWQSASFVVEILLIKPLFFLSVLIWESIWFSHFLGMLHHKFFYGHAVQPVQATPPLCYLNVLLAASLVIDY